MHIDPLTCLLACLLACLSRACRGVRPLSGLVSAIRRAEVLRHAGQYRELSTPVGTAGNDPSQTWHRVRHYWNLHLCASRYSAPATSVGARPATGTSTGSATSSPASLSTRWRPRIIDRVPPSGHKKSIPGELTNQVSSHPRGIRHRRSSICLEFACLSRACRGVRPPFGAGLRYPES